MVKVTILGATGYTGRELLSILSRHPSVALAHATTTTRAGVPIAEAHPSLAGSVSGVLEPFDAAVVANDSDVVLSCLPHKESMVAVAAVLEHNPKLKVVDLSGDFRFKDAAEYRAAYGVPHAAPKLLPKVAYGLPELFRAAIARAPLVANPGCYPTAALLPLAPFAKKDLLEGEVIVDAKSGVTGAGASPTPATHFPEANESVKAYSPLVHRHQPEMEEQLAALGADVDVHFAPHLVPMNRGILATIYATLTKPHTPAQVHALLAEAYTKEPFVRVLPPDRLPETKHTTGTNFVDVGFALHSNGTRLVLVSALDNLVKGASGQAVQNLNLISGLPETAGLRSTLQTLTTKNVVA